jgi:FkbM family methyltransferase
MDECRDLKRLGFSPNVIFDVGANVGAKAIRYTNEFPGAKLYCFEPVPATFKALQSSVRHLQNVSCVQAAVGATPGRATMHAGQNSELNSLHPALNVESGQNSEAVDVDILTLDNFCESNGVPQIDLLKTDTEGYDMEVLQGTRRMLAEHRVRGVLCEVSFRDNDPRHTSFFDVHRLLKSEGFEFFGLYDLLQRRQHLSYCNALFRLID